MGYVIKDSLDMAAIKSALSGVLTNAGFTPKEEYTDFDSRGVEGCLAVWSADSVRLEQTGGRLSGGSSSFTAELTFRVKLMGSFGRFDDYTEFNDRCCEVCAGLGCLKGYGSVTAELCRADSDMQQKRLVRELKAVFTVCMKEV